MNLLEFHQIFDQSITELMKAEDMTVADVWAGSMIKPIPRALPAVPYQWQDGSTVLITGDPFAWAERLDSKQGGDNAWRVGGTCACTAVSNVCKMAGMNVQEPDVVNLSIGSGMSDPKTGATTIGEQLRLLAHYGLPSHCEFNVTAKCDRIAECIEGGMGVTCGVNSGILQNKPQKVNHFETGRLAANHTVCMTGTVRNAATGALMGFYLCDSSYGTDFAGRVYVPLEMMHTCYETMAESFIVVTNARIR